MLYTKPCEDCGWTGKRNTPGHQSDTYMTAKQIKARLEYLRRELRAERMSWGESNELQGLAEFIEPGDVELLEAAGVPEFDTPKDTELPQKTLYLQDWAKPDENGEQWYYIARVDDGAPFELGYHDVDDWADANNITQVQDLTERTDEEIEADNIDPNFGINQ